MVWGLLSAIGNLLAGLLICWLLALVVGWKFTALVVVLTALNALLNGKRNRREGRHALRGRK